jgi:hypothetical protein
MAANHKLPSSSPDGRLSGQVFVGTELPGIPLNCLRLAASTAELGSAPQRPTLGVDALAFFESAGGRASFSFAGDATAGRHVDGAAPVVFGFPESSIEALQKRTRSSLRH